MPMGKFFKQNIVRDGLRGVIAVVDHAADSPLVLTGRKLDHTQKMSLSMTAITSVVCSGESVVS